MKAYKTADLLFLWNGHNYTCFNNLGGHKTGCQPVDLKRLKVEEANQEDIDYIIGIQKTRVLEQLNDSIENLLCSLECLIEKAGVIEDCTNQSLDLWQYIELRNKLESF